MARVLLNDKATWNARYCFAGMADGTLNDKCYLDSKKGDMSRLKMLPIWWPE
jgi:hypothetical protein